MIDIEGAGVGVCDACVRVNPGTGKDPAAACVENRGSEALGNEDFLAGVLTVVVRVYPMFPLAPIVGSEQCGEETQAEGQGNDLADTVWQIGFLYARHLG